MFGLNGQVLKDCQDLEPRGPRNRPSADNRRLLIRCILPYHPANEHAKYLRIVRRVQAEWSAMARKVWPEFSQINIQQAWKLEEKPLSLLLRTS